MEQRMAPKKRTTNFREDETKLLIKLWGNPVIQNKLYLTHRKAPVMRIIASNMQKHGFYRTPDEIKTRIRNLKCLYHRIKKSVNNGIGIGTVDPDWPHFKAMDRILNKKAQRRQHDLIYKENFLNANTTSSDMDIINIKREDDEDDEDSYSDMSSPAPPALPPDDGRCAFHGCTNQTTSGLFPAPNPRLHWDRFVAWTRASGNAQFEGLDPGQISARLRACERHFASAALALMRTGGGDRAGVVPSMNLPPPLDIDFGVDVPVPERADQTDRNDNSLVDVVIKTEFGSDDEFEETSGMPQLTPAPQFGVREAAAGAAEPAPQKPQQIKIVPKPASSLFPPKMVHAQAPPKTVSTGGGRRAPLAQQNGAGRPADEGAELGAEGARRPGRRGAGPGSAEVGGDLSLDRRQLRLTQDQWRAVLNVANQNAKVVAAGSGQKVATSAAAAAARTATTGGQQMPFPLLILNGMPAAAQAAHAIVQTKAQTATTMATGQRHQQARAGGAAAVAPAPVAAPAHTECSKLIKDLLDVQKETLELEKQRLGLEKQRLEFERIVGSQLLTIIPVFGGMLGKTAARQLRNGENGRKRKATECLDKDPKALRELLEDSIKKYFEEEEEDIKDEESDDDGGGETDSGVATNESRESNK